MGLSFYLVGIVALLSNTTEFKEVLTFGSRNFFDTLDHITTAVMLPFAGFIMAIFVGYVVDKSRIEAVLKKPLGFAFELWYFSLRYIVPVALFVVALSLLGVISI